MSGTPRLHVHEVISRTRSIDPMEYYVPKNAYPTERRRLGFTATVLYLTYKLLSRPTLDYLTAWNYTFLYLFSYVVFLHRNQTLVDTLTAFSQALWFIMRYESQADCVWFMIFHEVLGLAYSLYMSHRHNPKLSFKGFMIHGSRRKEMASDAESSDDEGDDNEESLHILSILFDNEKLHKILFIGYIASLVCNVMHLVYFVY